MTRLAALLRCPRHCVPLILFRWGLLGMAWIDVGMLWLRMPWPGWQPVIALCYATVYLLLWTLRLPTLTMRGAGSLALLGTDAILSVSAVWLAGAQNPEGAWSYALTPFVLGAFILPGVIWGWRGAAGAVAGYVTLHLVFYTPELAAHRLSFEPWLLDNSRSVIAAVIWPLSQALSSRTRQVQSITRTASPGTVSRPAPRPMNRPEPTAPTLGSRSLAVATPPTRANDYPASATLERRATRLNRALRQVVVEAEQQGLHVALIVEGREPLLPPGYVQLMVRASEIALENVRRHAGTEEAIVRLAQTASELRLSVRDHGAGLLDGTADLPGFHQLKLLRYRLGELGGRLEISEPDDDGVLFELTLPLNN